MTRKAYIDGIEGLRVALLKLGAEHAGLVATDAQGIEDDRHKKTAKLFEALELRLYEDGAISRRIQEDDRAAGRGEQGDLFDPPEEVKSEDEKVESDAVDAGRTGCAWSRNGRCWCGADSEDETTECDGRENDEYGNPCGYFKVADDGGTKITDADFEEAKADIERRKAEKAKSKGKGKKSKKGGK